MREKTQHKQQEAAQKENEAKKKAEEMKQEIMKQNIENARERKLTYLFSFTIIE